MADRVSHRVKKNNLTQVPGRQVLETAGAAPRHAATARARRWQELGQPWLLKHSEGRGPLSSRVSGRSEDARAGTLTPLPFPLLLILLARA